MGALMRAKDWSQTLVGPVAAWPQSLRTAVSIILDSTFPMLLVWGPEHVQFYNDAYRPILGATKHPQALGQRSQDCWPEIWDYLGPSYRGVLAECKAKDNVDQRFFMHRNGFLEETYFTFSLSPIRQESGGAGGVLVTVTETTERVIATRRLKLLRDLADRGGKAPAEEQAVAAAMQVLGASPEDVPFAALYMATPDGFRRAACQGFLHPPPEAGVPGWPLAQALAGETPVEAAAPSDAPGPWPEPPSRCLLIPVRTSGPEPAIGVLALGVSARLASAEPYVDFLKLVTGHLASSIAQARAHEAERRRAEALAEIDRAKTEFFSNVSHEFRTPLTLMLAPLEGLLARVQGPDAKDVDLVHRNALRLLKLVNNLLDFARVEAGRAQAHPEPTEAGALTADIASSFRAAAEHAGLELLVDCPPLREPVALDRDLWEKIVLNLVSNALKFTHEGRVEVRLVETADGIRLYVRDTGVGIPATEVPKLFQRFQRVEGTHGRVHEGTGIGLALVRELVRLHGGQIEVESTLGKGTEFRVSIPRGVCEAPAPATRREPGPLRATFVQEADHWSQAAPALPSPAGADLVLVVDDNADMRDYLTRILSGTWAVAAAADGEEALALLAERTPHAIISDIMMPRVDGLELLRQVRADPRLRDVPFILLSARAGEEARVDGVSAGADDYLVKPFSARELLARVGAHLRLARLRQESLEVRQEAERRIAEAERKSARIVETSSDGIFLVDASWTVIYANRAAGEWLHRDAAGLVGQTLWSLYPALAGSEFERVYRMSMQDRQPRHVEAYYEPLASWFEVRVLPVDEGIALSFRDVTERRRMEMQLRSQHERLEQLVGERTEHLALAIRELEGFNHMVSHDLRSHLRVMGAYSDLALSRHGEGLDPTVRGLLAKVRDGAVHTGEFLEHLMDLSRFQVTELAKQEVDVTAVAEATLARLREQEPARDVEWTVERGLRVHGDPALLAVVVDNLIGNAWKFTGRRPKALIRVRRDGGGIVVEDNGEGFDMEYVGKLFQPFERLHLDFPGTGIGLAGVARIVNRHGGRVWAAGAPGTGASFGFALPEGPRT